MAKQTVIVCDSCGQIIRRNADIYQLDRVEIGGRVILKSERYTDAAGSSDYNLVRLDFCPRCAQRLLDALERVTGKHGEAVEA